jgi:8-oxo-dGTP diphosphatase
MSVVVVAAIVERDDSFLLTRRLEGTHLAGLWEFPGGKVDGAETHAAALRREIREELGVDSSSGSLVLTTRHHYADRTVELFFYRCRLAGEPTPQLGQEMRWVPRHELTTTPLPPADEALVALLTASVEP